MQSESEFESNAIGLFRIRINSSLIGLKKLFGRRMGSQLANLKQLKITQSLFCNFFILLLKCLCIEIFKYFFYSYYDSSIFPTLFGVFVI